jgi:cell division transport system permease protein
MLISILRAIKFAFQDIFRNISLSLMTVLILVLMLLSVNTLIVIRFLTTEATQSIKEQIDVSIFFDHTATDEQIAEIKSYVDSFPEVIETTDFSRADVLRQFKEQYTDNEDIIASLEELGENPLGPTMVVKTREPGDYKKVIKALTIPEYEDVVVAKTFADTENAIDRIDTITTQVERFSVALTALFSIIAFLIIFNTIRVAIYTQRIEISIKKLVGATNWFIRSPYVIESFVFTVISVLITTGLVYLAAGFMDPYIMIVFGKSNLLTDYFLSNILLLFGTQFVAVLVLTVFSSTLAMRRHLRV